MWAAIHHSKKQNKMKTNAIGSHAKRMEKGGRIILVSVFVYNKKQEKKWNINQLFFWSGAEVDVV